MDLRRIIFDDPKHVGEASNIFVDTMMRFELLDYASITEKVIIFTEEG